MKKRTKKVLAIFISVLMIMSCFPLTAFAAVSADVNDFSDNPEIYATYSKGLSLAASSGRSGSSELDKKIGVGPMLQTCNLSDLKAGDNFSVTLWLKGVDQINCYQAYVDWDNTQIEPIAISEHKIKGTNYLYTILPLNQAQALVAGDSKNYAINTTNVAIPQNMGMSLQEIDTDMEDINVINPRYNTFTITTDHTMQLGTVYNDTSYPNEITGQYLMDYDFWNEIKQEDPDKGNWYDDTILCVINFQALVDSPDESTLWTVENQYRSTNNQTFYNAVNAQSDYSLVSTVGSNDSLAGDGRGKFKILGFGGDRQDAAPTTETFTVTYKDASGTTISTEEVESGASPASIPALPATTSTDTQHTTYAWDVNPSGATITAATTYTQVATTADHTLGAFTNNNNGTHSQTCSVCNKTVTSSCDYTSVVTDPTCTAGGYTTYTCKDCGYSYTGDATTATGHTYGAWTSNNNGTHSRSCTVGDDTQTADCSYTSVVTPATCTAGGYTTYTCTVCGYSYVGNNTSALGHAYGTPVANYTTGNAFSSSTTYNHTATCANSCGVDETTACTFNSGVVTQEATTTVPEITTYTCTSCGGTYTKETAPVIGHSHNYTAFAPTYTSGLAHSDATTYTHSKTCQTNDGSTCSAPTVTEACSFTKTATTAATCTVDGSETYTCSVCGGTYTVAIPATGHNYTTVVTAPTCTTAGYTTYTCTEGDDTYTGDVVAALGHNYDMTNGTVIQQATLTQPEITRYQCTRCDGYKDVETAPALTGVNVTLTAADKGTITLNDADVTAGATTAVVLGSTYTLTATPNDNCQFVGWEQNGKIVSENTTFTTTAYADVTYTPVFIDTVSQLNFVFLDMYNNVVSNQTVTNAADVAIPASTTVPGYDFVGWSATEEEIHSATQSMTITGVYEKQATLYTVTATGCDVTANGETVADTAQVTYNSQVTVSKNDATAWAIDGVTVAYGSSYTFFVGSNVTVTPVTEVVTAAPTVAITSSNQMNGTYKVLYVATRTIPAGNTFVQAGFVYGKNLTDAELSLAKVGTTGASANAGKVKALYMSSTSGDGQFSLTYGLSAQTGTASAKAFVVYKDAQGALHTIYSDASLFTY